MGADERAGEIIAEAKRQAAEAGQVRYVALVGPEYPITPERPDGPHFRCWPGGRIEHWPHGRPGRSSEEERPG
jgi:hypothetical protein